MPSSIFISMDDWTHNPNSWKVFNFLKNKEEETTHCIERDCTCTSTNTHIQAVCCVPSEESVANALHSCGVSQVSRVELTTPAPAPALPNCPLPLHSSSCTANRVCL